MSRAPDLPPPLPGAAPAAAAPPPPPPPPPAPETGAEPATHRLSSRVEGLTCPSCSGVLDVDAGLRVVECPYCDKPLLAVSEVGIRRLAVEPQIDADRARELARGWLAKGVNKDPKLETGARIGEAFLSFLPFYRVEADCLGFALGTEQRTRSTGSGKNRRTETYEVDVERSVERRFDHTYPALNVAEWGVQRVDLRGDPLVPFDPRKMEKLGMVFPPTGSEVAVKEAALASFKLQADPASGLHRVRFQHLETVRERLTVIYYPIWVVRYEFKERSYQVLVDAEDGTLSYGKAPGNDLYRAVMMVGTQAATMFVGTTALQLFGEDIGGFFFIGALLLAALFWAWRKFRYGGVIVEGSGTEPELGIGARLKQLSQARRGRSLTQALVGSLASGRRS